MKKHVVLMAAVAAAVLGVAAAATATGVLDGEGILSGPDADRASEVAVQAVGGGNANSVELDDEDGATYEVEVTKRDGTTVDVRLDKDFRVVVVESDSDGDLTDRDRDGDNER